MTPVGPTDEKCHGERTEGIRIINYEGIIKVLGLLTPRCEEF